MNTARPRGRGSRITQADCPECGERCEASDRVADAHRMWAKRHANRTGHTTLVETIATRSYEPINSPATTIDGSGS